MATKRTSKGRSPEQKKAEAEALHAQLAEGVEALRDSERWTQYLAFMRGFHRYSFTNLLLILLQYPEAAQVAGYRAWQAKGRQVRKGEKGIRIFGTGLVKVTSDDESTDGEPAVAGKRRVFFPVSVFDISQTDVMEGHEDHSTIAETLTGEDVAGIYRRVVDHLTGSGVTVTREPIPGAANGYTAKDDDGTVRVVIDSTLSPAQAAKTALHEAAHITLGHIEDDHAEYLAHRGRYEVEAESVAYVLAGMLDMDTAGYSFGYVAGWAERAEADVIKATAGRVLEAVRTLADALEVTGAEQAEEVAA